MHTPHNDLHIHKSWCANTGAPCPHPQKTTTHQPHQFPPIPNYGTRSKTCSITCGSTVFAHFINNTRCEHASELWGVDAFYSRFAHSTHKKKNHMWCVCFMKHHTHTYTHIIGMYTGAAGGPTKPKTTLAIHTRIPLWLWCIMLKRRVDGYHATRNGNEYIVSLSLAL